MEIFHKKQGEILALEHWIPKNQCAIMIFVMGILH